MITLFTAVTTEGWAELMWAGVDANERYLEPEQGKNMIFVLFFVIFMLFCSIVILNLFVGVVIESNYNER